MSLCALLCPQQLKPMITCIGWEAGTFREHCKLSQAEGLPFGSGILSLSSVISPLFSHSRAAGVILEFRIFFSISYLIFVTPSGKIPQLYLLIF